MAEPMASKDLAAALRSAYYLAETRGGDKWQIVADKALALLFPPVVEEVTIYEKHAPRRRIVLD